MANPSRDIKHAKSILEMRPDPQISPTVLLEFLRDSLDSLRELATMHPGVVLPALYNKMCGELHSHPAAETLRTRVEQCLRGRMWLRCENRTFSTARATGSYSVINHSSTLAAISINPRGDSLVTADEEGEVYLWDTSSGRLKATLLFPFRVHSVRHHPLAPLVAIAGGKTLSAVESCGAIWIADSTNLTRFFEFSDDTLANHAPSAMAWSSDGNYLVYGLTDSPEMYVVRNRSWDRVAALRIRGSGSRAVAFGCNDSIILAGSPEGYLTRWQKDENGEFSDFDVSSRLSAPVKAIAVSSTSERFAIAFGKVVRIVNPSSSLVQIGPELSLQKTVLDVAFLPSRGNSLAIISHSSLDVWEPPAATSRCIAGFTSRPGGLSSALNGSCLAVAYPQSQVHLLDAEETLKRSDLTKKLKAPGRPLCVEIDAVTQHAVWWGPDGHIRLTEIGSGDVVWSEVLAKRPSRIALSRGATWVAALTTEGVAERIGTARIVIWNRNSGRKIETALLGGSGMASLAFSADGGFLVVGSYYIETRCTQTGRLLSHFIDRNSGCISGIKTAGEDGRFYFAGTDSNILCRPSTQLCSAMPGTDSTLFFAAQGLGEKKAFTIDKRISALGPAVGLGQRYSRENVSSDMFRTSGISDFDVDALGLSAVILDQVRIEGFRISDFEDVVTLWDLAHGKCIGAMRSPHRVKLTSVTLSPCGSWVAVGDKDGWIRIWRAIDMGQPSDLIAPAAAIGLHLPIISITFAANGEQVLVAADTGEGVPALFKYALMG